MNHIIVHGRLTDDVKQSKVFTDKSGTERAAFRFTAACDRKRSREQTDFLNCVWFLPTGNKIAQYLTKGKGVVINGELQIQSYDDKDGNKRQSAEVHVSDLEFASGSKSKSTDTQEPKKDDEKTSKVDDDDDLPF